MVIEIKLERETIKFGYEKKRGHLLTSLLLTESSTFGLILTDRGHNQSTIQTKLPSTKTSNYTM